MRTNLYSLIKDEKVFKKKRINLDEMTAKELDEFLDKTTKRVFWEVGLWLLFVVVMLFLWYPAGIALLVITILLGVKDYYNYEAQGTWASVLALAFRKRVEENKGDDEKGENDK